MNFYIEDAKKDDIDLYLSIYDKAREFMISANNPSQRKGYPTKEILLDDIKNNHLKLIKSDDGIEGIFALIPGTEPTYINIYEGQWISDLPYYTIHRVASTFKHKGIFKEVVNLSLLKTNHLRIDTYKDNLPMQKAILKEGFIKCGIILLEDNSPRIAYELVK